MRDEVNPYSCTRPGNIFVGYERMRKDIADGLRNGNSFAVLGGRRCGKTSLLIQLEKDLSQDSSLGITPWPVFLDMQGVVPRSPAAFFEAIYSLLHPGTTTPFPPVGGYQFFLSRLEELAPLLKEERGSNWLVILLVDELDSALTSLPDDECFQNFRNLLMVSRFHHHFRVIATGVRTMADLISRGSSPLNNLRRKQLAILGEPEASQLIDYGFSRERDQAVDKLLFDATGRHPYLLQGVLEYLWEDRTQLDAEAVGHAARRFAVDHSGDFRRWQEDLTPLGMAIYDTLVGVGGRLSVKEIRGRLGVRSGADFSQAVGALSYHGLIDDSDPKGLVAVGTLFRRWREDNVDVEGVKAMSVTSRKVFVVHGKNMVIRQAMFDFLRAIGLEPLEWAQVKKATGKASPYVGEILEKGFSIAHAVLVLLTPDDEARLREHYWTSNTPNYEKELTGQARPNVLYEAGMAMGLFPSRTVLVEIGQSRPFTDIAGMHTVRLDDSPERRNELVSQLETIGCPVNRDGGDWYRVGQFTLT